MHRENHCFVKAEEVQRTKFYWDEKDIAIILEFLGQISD